MLPITCSHRGLFGEETEVAPGGPAHLRRFGSGSGEGRMIDESVAAAVAR